MGIRASRPRNGYGIEGRAIEARMKKYMEMRADLMAKGIDADTADHEAFIAVTTHYRYDRRTHAMKPIINKGE